MAARKRTEKSTQSGNGGADAGGRAFAVVVEALNAKFDVFGEALQGLRETMNQRFDGIDGGLANANREIALVKAATLDNSREIKELRRSVEAVDARKVDRDAVEGIVLEVLDRKGVH